MKIVMPQFGMTMQEGTITKWYKNDGDKVEKGEPLYEVESEKLTNEVEAPATGVLKIIVQAFSDESTKCGEVVAEIIED